MEQRQHKQQQQQSRRSDSVVDSTIFLKYRATHIFLLTESGVGAKGIATAEVPYAIKRVRVTREEDPDYIYRFNGM